MNGLKYCIVMYDKKLNRYIDKCDDIKFINEDLFNNKVNITFLNGSVYTYNMSSVRIMDNPQNLNVSDWVVYHNSKRLTNISLILRFGKGNSEDWVKIKFDNGDISSYPLKQITIVRNRTNDIDVKNFISYLKNVADITIGNEPEEDKNFFKNELNRLDITEECVLSDFLADKPIKKRNITKKLIFPFSTNASQIEAVKNALSYNISCIQGPPGTGKTQTILNIIANLLMLNKKIAVVAGNNEAVKNVRDKLSETGIKEIDASLGNTKNINLFFNTIHGAPQFGEIVDCGYTENSFNIIADDALKIYSCRIKKGKLEHLLDEYRIEQEKNNIKYAKRSHNVCNELSKWADKRSSQYLLSLAAYLEILSEKRKISYIQRVKLFFKYKILHSKQILENITDSIDFLQNKFYETKINELNNELSEVNDFLNKEDNEKLLNDYRLQSMYFLKRHLCKYYKKFSDFSVSRSQLKKDFESFVRRYPIVYSTTHALHYCSGDYLYDYVIMDESSQVDLVSASIAMACAKNIVFVGDQKQLPHVVQSQYAAPLNDLFSRYSLPDYYNYLDHSILSSIIAQYKEKLPDVLLNEHYRCDPQIIEFCNKRFYNDKLVVQSEHKKGNGITIIKNEAHCEFKRSNERQASIIINEILPVEKGNNIGVVAPYRAQVELLTNKINDNSILVDTVHKFQGKERDIMILSTVSDKIHMYDDEKKIDFLNNENLINVAISRAKKKLYVIASNEILNQDGSLLNDLEKYVSYYCSEGYIKDSKTYSVFDLMFDEYNSVLESLKNRLLKISEYQSENIIGTIINEICEQRECGALSYKHNYPLCNFINVDKLNNIDDQNFVENKNTHCDFLLYDILDKSVRLVVEVDGRTHDTDIQKQRDERKDRILKQLEIPVLRLKTTETYTTADIKKKVKSLL